MAEKYGIPMSLSPRFVENSSGQHAPYNAAFGCNLQPPHSSPIPNQKARCPSSSKRPIGRPPGAKNKPKPPIIITQDNNNGMKSAIIEVGAGSDVMEVLVQVARHRNCGIMVVHATGIISNVTLCNPQGQAPTAFTLYGPFALLGLHGSYLSPPALGACFPSSSQPLFIPNLPPSGINSSFEIGLSGFQGNVFRGIVAGKVMAANYGVTVTAVLFKNPEYHSTNVVTRGNIEEENIDNPRGGGCGGDHGGASSSGGDGGASSSGGDGGASCFGMPGFIQY